MNAVPCWLQERAGSWGSDPYHNAGDGNADRADSAALFAGPLLLIERSRSGRAFLRHALTARGFAVTDVAGLAPAEAAIADTDFAYAVISLRVRDGESLSFIQRLRQRHTTMRIVIVTDADSFASVIRALGAGADDYIPQPAGENELVDALLDRAPGLPPVPDTPLGLNRTCWEHVMRIYEQCDRNVSHTAQRLGMHRRSLQRSWASGHRCREPWCDWAVSRARFVASLAGY